MKPISFAVALFSLSTLSITNALASESQPIPVVASFTILADVVKNVGGDYVKVTSLVPANGDPHEFEPSPKDAKAVKNAAVTFVSGEGLETWFNRLAKASGSQKPVVTVSEGIKTHLFEEDGKQVTDPHVWNSIPNVMIWVKNIEQALEKADPASAKAYQANAQAYTAKLNALNEKIHSEFADIPMDQRKVLTSHDAFGYYGEEYKVSFLSPLGVSTETEATASDVASLINQIKEEHVKTYFIENSNNSRLVKQIASATHAQEGGELYPESLSGENGPTPTYLQMMNYNTQQIVKALK